MVFRKSVLHITGIAYTTSFTLAALGLKVFRTQFLPDDKTIGITPIKGYGKRGTYSKASQCWLDWMQHETGNIIKREYMLGNYVADGVNYKDKIVYEFFGCKYHGCHCYYRENRDDVILDFDKTPNELYYEAQCKLDFDKTIGYETKQIWECEFRDLNKSQKVFKDYCKERYQHYTDIDRYGGAIINEAFFGGRTKNLRYIYECNTDEEICYVDFISLYPDVLKNRTYPIGHPTVINENFYYTLESYFGFLKCKVLPPRDVYFPVLPLKVDGKLMFPLSSVCANERSNQECNHTDDDRFIINTWTREELKVALLQGYKMINIFEVFHYETVSETLFKQYISMWLKIKQEASGLPSWCQTEEQKQQFIINYETVEGIKLEYDKINRNKALRFIAKIFLNSF